MAFENKQVTADVIEVTEFPELIQRYQVRGVPKIVINEKVMVEGAVPEAQLLEKVLEAVG